MGVKNKLWKGVNRDQLRDLQRITNRIYDRNFKRITQGKPPLLGVDEINAVSAAESAATQALAATQP
jgi:Cdc6-like AAA superfamily ATPase